MFPKVISRSIEEISVLHVDDDPNQFEFIKFFLNQVDKVLDVTCVGTPDEVFRELDTGNYDCLVTDFKMPLMNGIDLSKKVRENHTLPIILYTGQGSEEVAEAAFTIGVDDYIRKEMDPSHYQVLAKRIRHVVEKKRAETLYQRVVEGIMDGLSIVVDNRIVYANQVQAEIFGATNVDEIIGLEASSFVHANQRNTAEKRMFEKSMNNEIPPFFKYTITRLDMTLIEVEGLTSVINYNGKKAFMVLTRDITEKNRLESERKRVEDRVKTIVDLAPDGIVTVSLRGVVTSVNPAFLKITGYALDEVLGKRFYQLGSLRNIDIRNNLKVFASIARGKLPPPVEFVFQYKDGTQGWGEAHLAFINNKDSRELMAIVRDITERKWVEKEINQYSDDFRQIVHERIRREDDQDSITWSNHMANSMGVELQDSLFTLKNSILHLREDPSQLENLLDKMELSVDSANIQLKELFDEDGRANTDSVDIFNLIDDSISEIQIPPEVSMATKFTGPQDFRVDSEKMKIAIQNLVNNALDGVTTGGVLHISCDTSVESLILEVKNTGNRLSEDQIQQLLNEGSIETDFGNHSIAISQKIVEEHGGSILVNSESGHGTSYTMILPRDYRNEIQSNNLEYIHQKTI
ncbi:PAS domain S-box protein [Candidatus Bathyarchaeota archaeon]|nr:PAS domain S-box protein [Candidatus Bathyarchaeota archaeon]